MTALARIESPQLSCGLLMCMAGFWRGRSAVKGALRAGDIATAPKLANTSVLLKLLTQGSFHRKSQNKILKCIKKYIL